MYPMLLFICVYWMYFGWAVMFSILVHLQVLHYHMQKFSQKDKNVENENVKLSPALFLFLEHPAVYPEGVHQPLFFGRLQGEPFDAVC